MEEDEEVKNKEIRRRIMGVLSIVENEIGADKEEDNEKATLRLIRSDLEAALDNIDAHDLAGRVSWIMK